MTPKQQAISVASMIGCLLDMYSEEEAKEPALASLISKLKKFRDTESGMRDYDIRVLKMARKNPFARIPKFTPRQHYVDAVMKTDKVWQDAINHFAERNISIETIATVSALYNLYEAQLSKHAKVKLKDIQDYEATGTGEFSDLESASNEVADYLIDGLSKYTGIKCKDLSGLMRKVQIKVKTDEMNKILESA